ncbi:neuraminidase-like domain-containing protein [Streptomyces sp. NPDC051554]|uniref:Tc toxin subunit A-related protein n=1 Tax=Streptomyces sp. NPDC051554 TaxID=3365656 RepID=UPI0037BCD449
MTTRKSPALNNGPIMSIFQPPDGPPPEDQQPWVSISAPTGRVVAGVAASMSINAFPGARYSWDAIHGFYASTPLVTFSQTAAGVDGVEKIRANQSGGPLSLTFPTPGAHTFYAEAKTTTGLVYRSGNVGLAVAAAVPPAFTVTAPAENAQVDLGVSGASVNVQVNIPADQYFPVKITLAWDGQSVSTDNVSSTTFQQLITLGSMPLGSRPISVTVADRDHFASTKIRTVVGRDVGLPILTVDQPTNAIGDSTGRATAQVTGTVQDAQSGMVGGSAGVAWALSKDGVRTPAQPLSGNDFGSWHAGVPLTGFGAHTIYVWATDKAGNTTPDPQQRAVTVVSDYVPKTLEERLNEREYLTALLSFAQEQITVPLPGGMETPPDTDSVAAVPAVVPGTPLDTATLVGVLGQPVDRLSQAQSAEANRGTVEINQLRVPIELLRARIAARHTPTGPGAAAEAAYRTAAYNSLLAAVGTSYAELRLARGADPEARRALAARLGIRLSSTAPDELDQLTLDDTRLNETALETVFGLTSTTATDPLRTLTTPLLLTWQLAGLALSWADQDQHPNTPRTYEALADPDVIGAGDVIGGPNGDPIRLLITQRAKTLADYGQLLNGLRPPTGGTAAQWLTAMLAQALPGADLADWENQESHGTDIGGLLTAAGLTRPGFLALRNLSRLAAAGALTTAEWNDAIAVLTGAHKRSSLLPAWKAQETTFVLSPDYFVLSADGPQVNPYRVDDGARDDWQSVLRSRTTQRQDLVDGNAQAVATAEQTALPILRDALLTDLAPTPTTDISVVGEEMTALFFVDVLAGGTLRTTRIRQAIESIQTLMSAKRSGEMPSTHPAAGWQLNSPDAFTRAWVWMGELGSWQAATTAFLFPERNLDPTLLVAGGSAQLSAFFDAIRGSGTFGADRAETEAAAYVKSIGRGFTYLDPTRSAAHQTDLAALQQDKPLDPSYRETFWAVPLLLAQRLQSAGDYRAALDWYWLVYPYDVAHPVSAYSRITAEIGGTPAQPDLTFPPRWTEKLDPFGLVETGRPTPFTRYTLLSVIRCHLDYADAEFSRETDESVANARSLYLTARRLLGTAALSPIAPKNHDEPTLPIPDLESLAARANVQLDKLRQGRNIAGMARTQNAFGAITVSQPTPFRFKTLLERARQLVAQAVQMEAGYLAALEKYDQRNLQVFDALKGIELSNAQITLAADRVTEANDAVKAAVAQRTKADNMTRTYDRQINQQPNQYERDLLDQYGEMRNVRNEINAVDTAVGILQQAYNAADLTSAVFSGGARQGIAMSIMAGIAGRGILQANENTLQARMDANQLKAGIEQRKDEWRLAKAASEQDSLVAAAEVVTVNDQVSIAGQEEAIATLQRDQATATLKFLNDQFTNADLYLWMSNTLGGVYRYFLQQATATARLAQAQLAFERAESAQTLIAGDYWQTPAELTAGAAQVNRRGLTGAEQLSQDLSGLEEYALRSERRRLNLSQTFSLAQLMPVEFLEFRRTGNLAFATPMALFDVDFPGHYLRMIRQVRTSIVALVPPDRGIRATLSSNGISRVTTRQDAGFKDIVVRHDPGMVALTSPVNASGVFELDAQSDMLLPFESSGVDTTWELRLPPAANPLDFSAIADVLLTVDYTALQDDTYRSQLTTVLNSNRERGSDRVFSLAADFPDQWYDLNNPADPTARSITLNLRDADFPVGVTDLVTSALAVRLDSGEPVPNTVVSLTRGTAGGEATATGGTASTRRGNAASWTSLYGTSPGGDWQLGFGEDAADLFESGRLDDIQLIVSWTGKAPLWT